MKKFPVFSLICLTLESFAQTGITCNPNTFYIIGNTGIEEFQITGSVITNNGVVTNGTPPNNSLAFCNNLDGTLFSPTFYANDGLNATYYNGTSWTTTGSITNCSLSNSGGAGNYLYYNHFSNLPACLDKYDGTAFTQIWTHPTLKFTVADLAVDDSGNVWTFAGSVSPITQFIQVISPTGQLIKSFPFNLNTGNGYGCFLLNGILYLGLGSSNPVYPETLLPITFTSTSATAGIPVPFTIATPDLASCNAGTPLSIPDYNGSSGSRFEFTIYPAVASESIKCSIRLEKNADVNLIITDALGKIIYGETMRTTSLNSEAIINVSFLSNGIYFVQIDNGKEKAVKKFVKE